MFDSFVFDIQNAKWKRELFSQARNMDLKMDLVKKMYLQTMLNVRIQRPLTSCRFDTVIIMFVN